MKAKSILLVEDDKLSREVTVGLIRRIFPDVTAYAANNGSSGLELFKEHTPDIVITDINMPELNGILMANAILSIKPDTKFIVLTADTGKAALEQCAGNGFKAECCIIKPINFQDLIAAITTCLESD